MGKKHGRIKIEDEHLLKTIRQLKGMEEKILRAMQVLQEELGITRGRIQECFDKLRVRYNLPDNCRLRAESDTGYLLIEEEGNG